MAKSWRKAKMAMSNNEREKKINVGINESNQ
jgi:hypothetical protein